MILKAITYAAEQFLQAADWERRIEKVLGRFGRAMNASHSYVFRYEVDPEESFVTKQSYEWTAPGVKPQTSNTLMGLSYRSAMAVTLNTNSRKASVFKATREHLRTKYVNT